MHPISYAIYLYTKSRKGGKSIIKQKIKATSLRNLKILCEVYFLQENLSRLWALIGSEAILSKREEWYTHGKVIVSLKVMVLGHVWNQYR